jgi:hypothetical protein
MFGMIVAYHLIVAHMPNGQELLINSHEIVALRTPPEVKGHVVEGVHCIVLTTDGNFLSVTEDCHALEQELEKAETIIDNSK